MRWRSSDASRGRGSDGDVTAGASVVAGTAAVVARLSGDTGGAVMTKTLLFTADAAAAAGSSGQVMLC